LGTFKGLWEKGRPQTGSSVDRPEVVGASTAIRRRSAVRKSVKVFGWLVLLVYCATCVPMSI
jgi:hypothetical protein